MSEETTLRIERVIDARPCRGVSRVDDAEGDGALVSRR